MLADDLDAIFHLPLSQQALEELEQLQLVMQDITYDPSEKDVWLMIWGGEFTSKKYYNFVYDSVQAQPVFRALWKSGCTPRIKFFA